MKNTPPNFIAPPHVPPFPETPPPLHRPRNHMMPSGHPPPPPPHGIDHPAGPAMPVDHHQHAYSHGMGRGPPNMDRVPYPHGYEGSNSPRSWNPQVSFIFRDTIYMSEHFSWGVSTLLLCPLLLVHSAYSVNSTPLVLFCISGT